MSEKSSVEVSKDYVIQCLTAIEATIHEIRERLIKDGPERIPFSAPLFMPAQLETMDKPPFTRTGEESRSGGWLKSAGCDKGASPCSIIIQVACFLLQLCAGLDETRLFR